MGSPFSNLFLNTVNLGSSIFLKILKIFTDASDKHYVSVLNHYFLLSFSQIGSSKVPKTPVSIYNSTSSQKIIIFIDSTEKALDCFVILRFLILSILTFSLVFCSLQWTAVAQWLRCCATNRKVAGSIPDVIGTFH